MGAPAGTKFRFQYKASKEADWFEIVAALYEHVGDVKTDAKGVPLPKQGKIVKRKVLRGAAMDDFISDGFETDKAGNTTSRSSRRRTTSPPARSSAPSSPSSRSSTRCRVTTSRRATCWRRSERLYSMI